MAAKCRDEVRSALRTVLFLATLTGWPAVSSIAQTPPSASEIEAYTGLHAAVAKGDADAVIRQIGLKSDLNARDGHGRTPLHVAAHGGHREIVQALAKAGADMRAKDSRSYDIITIAAVRDDAAMIDLAVSLGADPEAITSPYDGTALIAAAHLGHVEVVRSLIKAGAPLDHVNNLGWTAVIEAIVLGDGGRRHTDTMRLLVQAGANTQIADREGVTPLEHAKRRGYAEMQAILRK